MHRADGVEVGAVEAEERDAQRLLPRVRVRPLRPGAYFNNIYIYIL